MNTKSFIWLGMIVGSSIGGFLPTLFGGSALGMTSVFTTALGGLLGIWAGYKISTY